MLNDFWVTIPGFEGYVVNPSGDIRSVDRYVIRSDTLTPVRQKGVMIKSTEDKRGYPRCSLSISGSKRMIRNHRAVAMAYLPNPENKPQVNHKDGVKSNNSLSNLEWSTNKENMTHAYDNGLNKALSGNKANRFESEISVYKDGIHLYNLSGNIELAEHGYDYDYRLVSAVILGKRKTHMGCTFRRVK